MTIYRLNNPKTVLEELKYCLQEFEMNRVKNFHNNLYHEFLKFRQSFQKELQNF